MLSVEEARTANRIYCGVAVYVVDGDTLRHRGGASYTLNDLGEFVASASNFYHHIIKPSEHINGWYEYILLTDPQIVIGFLVPETSPYFTLNTIHNGPGLGNAATVHNILPKLFPAKTDGLLNSREQ